MATKLEILERTLEQGFPFDEDIPTVLADDERVKQLRAVIDEVASDDFAVEMVGDPSFRTERRGSEGFVDGWRDWTEAFATLRITLEEAIEADPHVLVLVRQTGKPRGSDVEISSEPAALWTFEGDRVVRISFYLDRDEARRAAGLEPG